MTIDKFEAARSLEARWAEDERRALHVKISDERPEYPMWMQVIMIGSALLLIVVAVYLLAAGMGL